MSQSVTARRIGDIAIIAVTGDLDHTAAVSLRAAITAFLHAAQPVTAVHVDLSTVAAVDALGLGTLVVACRVGADAGVRLLLTDPPVELAQRLLKAGLPAEHLSRDPPAVPPPARTAATHRAAVGPAGRGPGRCTHTRPTHRRR